MAIRKLEIGGGPKPREGYEQLDVVSRPHVDYVGHAWKIPTADNSFSEVYGRHVFEHFSPYYAGKALEEFKRVLISGGRLHLIIPNLLFHMKQLTMPGMSEYVPMTNFDHALSSIYGHQTVHPNEPEMCHKWGYTPTSLVKLLLERGFKAKLIDCRECDIEIVGTTA